MTTQTIEHQFVTDQNGREWFRNQRGDFYRVTRNVYGKRWTLVGEEPCSVPVEVKSWWASEAARAEYELDANMAQVEFDDYFGSMGR